MTFEDTAIASIRGLTIELLKASPTGANGRDGRLPSPTIVAVAAHALP